MAAGNPVVNTLLAVLKLPAFTFGVLLLYWSFPIAIFTNWINIFNWFWPRNDAYGWAKMMKRLFAVRVRKYGTEPLYTGGKCIYLANHRSWADFFLDAYLVECRGALLSRMAVAFVFPVFLVAVHNIRGVVLFKRQRIRDKEAFNKWLDWKVARSVVPGLVVFPEGHRGQGSVSQPLKRGLLHYAYSRKLPVQIVMTRNKEDVLCEHAVDVRWGVTLVTGYSAPLHSADYDDFETFWQELQQRWATLWEQVYAADAAGLPELKEGSPMCKYPAGMIVVQFLLGIVAVALFIGTLAACVCAFLSVPLSLQPVVGGVLTSWAVASFVTCQTVTPVSQRKAASAAKKQQ